MENQVVLITGSNGLLGQKLVDLYVSKKNRTVVATGRGQNRNPNTGDYTYVEMDILDPQQIEDVILRHTPNTIIHTAAMTNVDACELDPEACERLNVESVANLVNAANKVGAHFVFVSTDFIFDGENGPYKEEDEPRPLSIYGHSKLRAEQLVRSAGGSWAIARTVLVYGLVADMSRSNIVLWARESLSKGKEINVVDDQYRSPTLAEDLALGCYLIEQQRAEGVFNISGKDQMNIYELVQRVANYFGLTMDNVSRIDSKSLNQPAKRPPVTGFDLTKSRRVLGYEPHSFDEGIRIIYEQFERATI
ncbi:MAG: NAD(P)-dependent oxidoreductase [Bacteroidia bacterium]|nr:NAD(P)-dependent oxidoreductase [Bacteroidia bacterium]